MIYLDSAAAMPADDIVAEKIPATGVVVIAGQAPAFGPENIVPVVNRQGEDVMVCLALPVAEPPAELPAPARYRVLPEIEAAATVRSGPAARCG